MPSATARVRLRVITVATAAATIALLLTVAPARVSSQAAPSASSSRPFPAQAASLQGAQAQIASTQASPESAREAAYRANNLGVAYLEQYNYEEAGRSFERALSIDPALTMARINLAIARLYTPDLAAAAREAQAALSAQPDSLQAQYVLGLAARGDNRVDDGVAAFQRVLAADPRDTGALVNLGQILAQQRKFDEAIALFKRALVQEPFNATATYNLGIALMRGGQAEEGQRVTAQFQALRESGHGVTYSNTYLEQGRYAEALASTGAEPELVTRATPAVSFIVSATIAAPPPRSATAIAPATAPGITQPPRADLPGSFTLADLDGDGDLDLFDVNNRHRRLRLFTNDGGRFTDASVKADLTEAGHRGPRAVVAGDYDNDGRPDLLVLMRAGVRLYRQTESGQFVGTLVWESGDGLPASDGLLNSVAFADVDHDGDLDIVLLGSPASPADAAASAAASSPASVSASAPAPRSTTASATPTTTAASTPASTAGAAPAAPAPTSTQRVLRNNGDGTFTDVTAAAKLDVVAGDGLAIVPTDYDNRRDLDLLMVYANRAPALFRNMRDGTFADDAAAAGLAPAPAPAVPASAPAPAPASATATSAATTGAGTRYSAVAAGDINKDGFTDLFFGRADNPGLLWLSDGNGRFHAATAGPAPTGVVAAQFVDYDNDGLLDLVGLTRTGLFVWRNLGSSWIDVTAAAAQEANAALAAAAAGSGAGAAGDWQSMAAGDIDDDGDTDIVVKSAGGVLAVLTNQGGSRQSSLRVRLAGQVSNRSAVGAKIDVRAGSLRQKLERSAAAPAVAPADILFGLGTRAADVVRVLWPSGTVQAEATDPAATSATATSVGTATASATPPAIAHGVQTIKELDRKPSSCPFLYTWNGERFEFITDFMGGGEMGYLEEPGLRNTPDPEEFTRITDRQLQPRDGRYELRVTNELEETLFLDHLRLLAVAHPADVEIYPREGLVAPPFPTFEAIAARGARPPARVLDDAGRDVTDKAAALDRRFIDGFPLDRIRGYAKPHTLTIEAGDVPGDLLLLTGWTDYAFSSDNLAASQAGLGLAPPTFEVRDAHGRWRTIATHETIPVPIGRPQTVIVDLQHLWRPPHRAVRISTNMRIYWDQIRIATRVRELEPEAVSLAPVTALAPLTANLRWRGFSAEATREEPYTYDYARVSPQSPWKQMPGRYTREGDVRELLQAVDDQFVISRPGDEVALSFDATALPPLPAGWRRTFLLHSDGFSKEMDLHSASPDQAWPLPFHGMTRYPYAAPEAFPFTPERRASYERYNTRIVSRSVPALDTHVLPPTQPPPPRTGNGGAGVGAGEQKVP